MYVCGSSSRFWSGGGILISCITKVRREHSARRSAKDCVYIYMYKCSKERFCALQRLKKKIDRNCMELSLVNKNARLN